MQITVTLTVLYKAYLAKFLKNMPEKNSDTWGELYHHGFNQKQTLYGSLFLIFLIPFTPGAQ